MAASSVLVLTQRFDPTADWVVDELNRRGAAVFRCDAADFPQRLMMAATLTGPRWSGTRELDGRTLALDTLSGLYYRRPTGFESPDHLTESERAWSAAEARIGFAGVLSACDRWLNHPARIAHANYKPAQLAAATNAGLTVPPTIITNDPKAARAFAEQTGPVIYKPMSAAGVAYADGHRTIYATPVQAAELDDPAITRTAHMVQAWVEHAHAVRLTVVDDRMFAAAIHASTAEAHTDWRSDYGALRYEVTEVPSDQREAVRNLMRALGLRFGALDFLATEQGWTFLEVNPNGQWAWIDELAPSIAAAIADALTTGDAS